MRNSGNFIRLITLYDGTPSRRSDSTRRGANRVDRNDSIGCCVMLEPKVKTMGLEVGPPSGTYEAVIDHPFNNIKVIFFGEVIMAASIMPENDRDCIGE